MAEKEGFELARQAPLRYPALSAAALPPCQSPTAAPASPRCIRRRRRIGEPARAFGARVQRSAAADKKRTVPKHSPFLWRRKRDLNPRAGFPTYSLSRGAPSPLGYFSMAKNELPIIIQLEGDMAERVGFEPTALLRVTGFQDQLLKPLGHLSKCKKATRRCDENNNTISRNNCQGSSGIFP